MRDKNSLEMLIREIPKAELHLHIEGTLEPKMMIEIARRNDAKPKYGSVEEARAAYNFRNLQDFLDVYYEGVKVLQKEQDFYDLTWAYLEKARSQNVLHAEVFFDPQAHMRRDVKFDTVIRGIYKALRDGEKRLEVSTKLIMCFLRDLSVDSALETLEEALSYKDWIVAVGLDSSEIGNPPSKFQKVFERAMEEGFLTVAHAGEEGPTEYVWEAISLLKVSRIDHGNHALEDEDLVRELARQKIPLTLCPLSNLKLGVIRSMEEHPLKKMLDKGLLVTVNSDDPAYFGGYINENYIAVQKALGLNAQQIYKLARNSFQASFLSEHEKQAMFTRLEKLKVTKS
ncbi:MAG: adenosine deaminase [Candidatus Bathyarchaeia archaeon]